MFLGEKSANYQELIDFSVVAGDVPPLIGMIPYQKWKQCKAGPVITSVANSPTMKYIITRPLTQP